MQIGNHICPEPDLISGLASQLFYNCSTIESPIIKAIYFHHEFIRIHPFVDENGRVGRIAKNWILMYDLNPPIFINDAIEKIEYITTLSKSFYKLNQEPAVWNEFTTLFFNQELNRLSKNLNFLYNSINEIGKLRRY